jgi:outer membrane lipoprotein carrier protein
VAACLVFVAAAEGAGPDVAGLLRGVENRYNRATTLTVRFEQTYEAPRRGPRTEAGLLYLRKPGRMRWQYSEPAGKLFISDGRMIYLYTPANNRVERSKMKQSEDMRAPLAFLLGKLDFWRDFRRFVSRQEGADTWIIAEPSSARAPFTRVEFRVAPSFEIRQLIVAGDGGSRMEFRFDQEQLNPPLQDSLFRFQPPLGAEIVEAVGEQ